MPVNHAIPLRDFWTATEVEPGRYRHERRFGAPRLQHKSETVWLTGEAAAAGSLMINEAAAGMVNEGKFELEITAMLKHRNVIWLDLRSETSPANVLVEIRRPDIS